MQGRADMVVSSRVIYIYIGMDGVRETRGREGVTD